MFRPSAFRENWDQHELVNYAAHYLKRQNELHTQHPHRKSAVPRVGRLVGELSPRHGINPSLVHVRFVVENMTKAYFRVLRLYSVSII